MTREHMTADNSGQAGASWWGDAMAALVSAAWRGGYWDAVWEEPAERAAATREKAKAERELEAVRASLTALLKKNHDAVCVDSCVQCGKREPRQYSDHYEGCGWRGFE